MDGSTINSSTVITEAPHWFIKAINTPFKSRTITVDGKAIAYRSWGSATNPGLIFVHGNGAHSHWWDFVAPFFIDHYSVVALDLGGMGESEHRLHYTADTFVSEIMAVSCDSQFLGKPTLIGHSMGGKIAMKAANEFSGELNGVIMIDSPCLPPNFVLPKNPNRRPSGEVKVYKTAAEIKEKFRLIPSQPCVNAFILDYIAQNSIKQVNGGWTWKFDSQLNERFDFANIMIAQPAAECNVLGFIYGDNSKMFTQEIREYNDSLFGNRTTMVEIEDAGHHLILDQPLRLVAELHKMLAINNPPEH